MYKNGKKDGHGVYQTGNLNYEGEFKLDLFDGQGILNYKNDKISLNGTFEEG
jgi:hypothetical protein